ncbi:hypothetical protein C7445_1104 [Alicyclobacillus sacchari]|uniref:Uncharacterized protein n=1 Tax=Alicyclobacillus sacchari TaxID=392010 RepID=A0A4R8LJK6_9BACL|nr:hypothetical protein C7445_1104 [Alicyclobacillus sacchari]GMA58184.1 hypothetical protein GCM10025858_26870 [Alicyclobacillus sacchari]
MASRKRDIGIAESGLHRPLGAVAISGVIRVFVLRVVFGIPQVRVQFGFEHLLDGAREKILEHALDVVNILQLAISNELTDLLLGYKFHVDSLPL